MGGESTGILDFAIIGAQKSASTFVQDCLADHPQIEMPPGESRHFEDPFYLAGAVRDLPALFGPRRAGVRRGIKRPDYLARPSVAERLAREVPDARLIVVLRDPAARAVSAYFDYVRLGFAPLYDIDTAFDLILSGRMQERYPRVADVIEYGMYAKHLARYLGFFPRNQLLVLFQEDLVREPHEQISSAYAFLDVDDAFRPPSLARRPNASIYSPMRLRLLRSRNRWLFRYAADRSRREPKKPSPFGFAWAGTATVIDRFVLARLDGHRAPRLGDSVDRRLRGRYAADVSQLEVMLERDLACWSG